MNALAHSLSDAANDPSPEALRLFALAMTAASDALAVDIAGADCDPAVEHAAKKSRAALFAALEVPEGCTPADARVLRKANHDLAGELDRLRTLLDRRPSYAGDLTAWKAWTETVYVSDNHSNVKTQGRYLPVVEMREPAPERMYPVEPALVDQPEAEIAALEREHMGDPDKGTGIYAGPLDGCRCEACVPQGDPFDPDTRQNIRMILCATCGNKRCPHATDHRNACTNSNEPGQKGSSWEHVWQHKAWPTSESVVLIEPEPSPVAAFQREHLGTPYSLPVNGPSLTIKTLALKCADSFLAIEIAGDMDDPTSPLWPVHHANEKALDEAILELLRPAREPSAAEREAARVLATSPMVRA